MSVQPSATGQPPVLLYEYEYWLRSTVVVVEEEEQRNQRLTRCWKSEHRAGPAK